MKPVTCDTCKGERSASDVVGRHGKVLCRRCAIRHTCPSCKGWKGRKLDLCERCIKKFAPREILVGGMETNRRRH